jgi:arginine/lysine/ornithine decarboxylase
MEWANDRVLMRQVNSKFRKISKTDIQDYVLKATAQKRAIIGIFEITTSTHIGVCEILMDRAHKNANLDILIDFKRYDIAQVLDEALPALFQELKSRFGAEKAVILTPESHQALISYLDQSAWRKEGVLKAEFPNAIAHNRIDAIQYGWLL